MSHCATLGHSISATTSHIYYSVPPWTTLCRQGPFCATKDDSMPLRVTCDTLSHHESPDATLCHQTLRCATTSHPCHTVPPWTTLCHLDHCMPPRVTHIWYSEPHWATLNHHESAVAQAPLDHSVPLRVAYATLCHTEAPRATKWWFLVFVLIGVVA